MTENRLGRETSPYLLQHKDNPVHWRAWGPEALAEAKQANKPILLSVGYAACHWCHVMAHESFEDAETATVMNELFVNIKLDREERPDIDAVYMAALHRMGEHGGWPMTMFLDCEARPFWGGTYFPKTSRWGRPAFVDVLRVVSHTFHVEHERVARTAEQITRAIAAREKDGPGAIVSDRLLADLTSRMVQAVDPIHGGLEGAPKFPQWSFFWLLWRGAIRYGVEPAKAAVIATLTNICQGGIYDHLGGGFARYSVDKRWLAPHFEKMLYDNALLVDLLTEAWRETHDPLFKSRVMETVAWLLREMTAEGGGFAASLDADSEDEEGKFYVWSQAEIEEVLGADDAAFFGAVYGVTPEGNWEGRTILNRLAELEGRFPAIIPDSPPPDLRPLREGAGGVESQTSHEQTPLSSHDEPRLAQCRAKLLARRAARVRPGWDDKVLADWNGLTIAALARASQVFGEPEWLAAAARAFAFVKDKMTAGGRLWHSHRLGRANAPATAADYANMIWAAVRLYQATLDKGYLESATDWTAVLDRHYWRSSAGGYATTADDTADVIVRLTTGADDAAPNANAIMLSNLSALALLSGEGRYAGRAAALLRAFASDIAASPLNHSGLLANALDVLAPQQVAIVGLSAMGSGPLHDALYRFSIPGALEFVIQDMTPPLATAGLAGKTAADGRATAYVCLGTQCSPPVTDAGELGRLLGENRRANGGPV